MLFEKFLREHTPIIRNPTSNLMSFAHFLHDTLIIAITDKEHFVKLILSGMNRHRFSDGGWISAPIVMAACVSEKYNVKINIVGLAFENHYTSRGSPLVKCSMSQLPDFDVYILYNDMGNTYTISTGTGNYDD